MLEKLIDQTIKALFGEKKTCRLDAVAKLQMGDVKILNDADNLRFGAEPKYLLVQYKGENIATVYSTQLDRHSRKWSEDDQQYIAKVLRILGTYYS